MLTQDDINNLLEAVELWKDMVPMEGHSFGDMMQVLMSGENREDAMAKMRAAADEARRKHVLRKEQGILLQAKLIQMRDKLDVEEALKSAGRNEPPL